MGIWAAVKVLLLGPLIWVFYQYYPPSRFGLACWTAALLFLPYLAYELQVGNVQFFLVEMVCAALLLSNHRSVACSILLGFATAIKVWPAFILPFLALRGHGRWRIGVQALTAAAAFTVAPGLWLGWRNLFELLAQWFTQERTINALLGDRFPCVDQEPERTVEDDPVVENEKKHGESEQRSERDGISVDDPLRGRGRTAEVGADRPQRDVHDRRVERDHQEPGRDRSQRQRLTVRPSTAPGAWDRVGGQQLHAAERAACARTWPRRVGSRC